MFPVQNVHPLIAVKNRIAKVSNLQITLIINENITTLTKPVYIYLEKRNRCHLQLYGGVNPSHPTRNNYMT